MSMTRIVFDHSLFNNSKDIMGFEVKNCAFDAAILMKITF